MKESVEHSAPKIHGSTRAADGAARNRVFFQPKLTINQPGDVYEQEADTMAGRVMRITSPKADSIPFFVPEPVMIQRKCNGREEEHLHRKEMNGSAPAVDSDFEQYVTGLSGRGARLSVQERSFFEPRFNRDFSDVRIHTDLRAVQSAQCIDALAYTTGTNIVFNQGQYQPGSESGRRLLAHELTHVVQQSSDVVKRQEDPRESLVDEGRQGRTFAPRGRSRSGNDLSGRVHAAMDVPGPRGSLIYCPADGMVIFARAVSGYGNLVSIFHAAPPETELAGIQPLTSHYAHLDSIHVSEGQTLGRQSVIGTMGNTTADAVGSSGAVPRGMGVHLHFSVLRMNRDGPVARLSSRIEERLAIRPDTWLSELGVEVARREYSPAAPGDPEVRRSPSPETTTANQIIIQRFEQNTGEMHRGIATDYRRYLGMPESEFDEQGRRQGWSDSNLIYGSASRTMRLEQPQIETLIERAVLSSPRSMLPIAYRQQLLSFRSNYPELDTRFDELVDAAMDADLFFPQQGHIAETGAVGLLEIMTRIFILDPSTSSLDLLPGGQGEHYRDFSWGANDYPGGARGANEGVAAEMTRDLSAIRPERRANTGDDAIVTRSEFERDSSLREYITNELRAIPDFDAASGFNQGRGHRLNQHALESFLQMREAALNDGVPLIVVSSYRSPATARANAERSGNPSAVASFSAHTLGLAMDLRMSYSITRGGSVTSGIYAETVTTPMQNVVDMRQSPIHKWLFIHGAQYGWFPYQNEPWHWEYNPVGFRDTFLSNR